MKRGRMTMTTRDQIFTRIEPNEDSVVYYYSSSLGVVITEDALLKLVTASDSAAASFTTRITFSSGTFNRCWKGEAEIHPTTSLNIWLLAQECVTDCRFSVNSKKRPAIIKEHFANCRIRQQMLGRYDPLTHLCQAMREAEAARNEA
ncbi:hypothetical protein BT69DRAFT_998693 [Atractiella rhizophila]|nr:hypothetical protein BT69DRAFT_998693 [Atractiella rhizophila]